MKRIYASALVLSMMLISASSFGQNYYALQNYGYAIQGTQSPNKVINPSKNDVLSGWISLPFSFSFYGNSVSGLYISDNGYITFDQNASSSYPSNKNLPDANAPSNSIFAFWDDLEVKNNTSGTPDVVQYWTEGTSPNRKFVVNWQSVTVQGGGATDYVTIWLALNESDNSFDVIIGPRGTTALSGTIGAQLNSTTGFAVSGSPNIDIPAATTTTANTAYHFIYGTQGDVDAFMVGTTLVSSKPVNASTAFSGYILNYGSKDITSMDINYSIDGGATVTDNLTGLSIQANGGSLYTFNHSDLFKNLTPGKFYRVKMWTSNINGGTTDGNSANDSIGLSVFMNNGTTGNKHVLVEEGTGAWCGYCPDGHLILKDILKTYPNAIGVTLHNKDSMTVSEGNQINNHFNNVGYPYGMVDRNHFATNPYGGPAMSRDQWKSAVDSRLKDPTPVDLTITPTWNQKTKTVNVKVDAKFVDYAVPGDLRLSVYIIEDSIRGNDGNMNVIENGYQYTVPAFTQHNYFSSGNAAAGGNTHPLYTEPYAMIGYLHNHVLMGNITGDAWGDNSVIPNTPTLNSTYSATYTYTFPDATFVKTDKSGSGKYTLDGAGAGMNKPWNSKIVAFVSYGNNSTFVNSQEVLNSAEARIPGVTGIQEVEHAKDMAAEVFPNPTNSVTHVAFNLKNAGKVKVEIYNSVGQKVKDLSNGSFSDGMHYLYFDASEFNNGVYFINISTGDTKVVKQFVVAK